MDMWGLYDWVWAGLLRHVFYGSVPESGGLGEEPERWCVLHTTFVFDGWPGDRCKDTQKK